jgi:small multidrug resistance family-3 protein
VVLVLIIITKFINRGTTINTGGVNMFSAIILFLLAGLAEIGGGYLVWLWLRESKPYWYGIVGSMILFSYGVIPTLQKFPTFGRVYAAYGGVFIILAVFWGWFVDKKTPDMYDWIGALVCLLGVSIMLWAPRH